MINKEINKKMISQSKLTWRQILVLGRTSMATMLAVLSMADMNVAFAHSSENWQLQTTINGWARYHNNTDDSSANLHIVGQTPMREPDWWYGGSYLGATFKHRSGAFAHAEYNYSDNEHQWQVDHAFIGYKASDIFDTQSNQPINATVTAGKLNPILSKLPSNGYPSLLMQGLVSDDHWHSQGLTLDVQLNAADNNSQMHHHHAPNQSNNEKVNNEKASNTPTSQHRIRVGLYDDESFLGTSDQKIGLYSLGYQVQPKQLPNSQLSLQYLYAPQQHQLVQLSENDPNHTHSTELADCGVQQVCLNHDSHVLIASVGQQLTPQTKLTLQALHHHQSGEVQNANGYLDYQGDMTGLAVDVRHHRQTQGLNGQPHRQQFNLTAEMLVNHDKVVGNSATLLAPQAGIHPQKTSPLYRLSAGWDYELIPHWTLTNEVFYQKVGDDSKMWLMSGVRYQQSWD